MWQAGYYLFGFMIWIMLILNYVNQFWEEYFGELNLFIKNQELTDHLLSDDDEKKNLNNTKYRNPDK